GRIRYRIEAGVRSLARAIRVAVDVGVYTCNVENTNERTRRGDCGAADETLLVNHVGQSFTCHRQKPVCKLYRGVRQKVVANGESKLPLTGNEHGLTKGQTGNSAGQVHAD